MDSWNPKIIVSPKFSDRMIMDYHTSMGGQATSVVTTIVSADRALWSV